MATVTSSKSATPDSGYVDFDEFIDYQLRKARGGIHQTDVLIGAVVLALVLLVYLLTFVVLDQWVFTGGFSPWMRTILVAVIGCFTVTWGAYRIFLPLMRRINIVYAARQIERAFPELKNTLLTWVELRNTGRTMPPEIRAAIERRAAREMSHQDIDEAVDRRWLLQASYALMVVTAVFVAYSLLSPKSVTNSLWRALFPSASVTVATRTEILNVTPGDTEVLARSQLDVSADLAGVIPDEVVLRFSTADRRFVDEPISMRRDEKSPQKFNGLLAGESGRGLLQDLTYYIVAGDAQTREYRVRVNQPPSATVTGVSYDYPAYMGLDDASQSGSTIDAWEGTSVTLLAESNMPVKSATLIMSDTDNISERAEEYPMQVTEGTKLSVNWKLAFRPDGTFARFYHIQVTDDRGQVDPQPAVHAIKVRPDKAPEIALIQPTQDIEAPANAVIPLAYRAHDPDFLLRRVTLRFEKLGEPLPDIPVLYEGPPYESAVQSTYRLDLAHYLLKPGDTLTFYLEAEDNMEPFGDRLGNKRRTPKLNIKIVEPVEQQQVDDQLKQQEQQIQEKLNEAEGQEQKQAGNEKQPEGEKDPQDAPMPEAAPMPDMPQEPMPKGEEPRQQPEEAPSNNANKGRTEKQPQPGQPEQTETQPSDTGSEPMDNGKEMPPNGEKGTATDGDKGSETGEKNPPTENSGKGNTSTTNNSQTGSETGDHQSRQSEPGTNPKTGENNSNKPGTPPDSNEKRGQNRAADDEALRELLRQYGEEKNQKKPEGKSEQSDDGSKGPDQPQDAANNGTQTPPGDEKPADAASADKMTGDSTNANKPESDSGQGTKPEKVNPPAPTDGVNPGNSPMPGESPMPNADGQPMPNGEKPMPQKGRHGDGLKPQQPMPNEPMPGQPGQPMPGQPGEPMPGQPGQPMPGQPGQPMPGQPGQPMPGQPGQPMPGQPDQPMPGQPGQPMPGQPGQPMPGQPGQPMPGQPGQPMPGQPGEPMPGQPGQPMPGQPGQPMPGQPGQPMPGQPGQPMPGQPGEPMPGQPGQPMPGQPGQPGQPMPGQPGQPMPGQPGQPMPGQPGEPMPGQPGQPMPGQPGQPMPGQPGEPMPGQPSEPMPGQPSQPMPGQPGQPMPGQPGEPMPGQPGEPMPGQPGQPMPGQPGQPMPGQPGEPMPGQPGQPGQSTDSAQPGQASDGEGSGEGKPGSAPSGKAAGRAGKMGGGGNGGGQLGEGSGRGPGEEAITPDAADLESKRRAADLALKRLRDQLERGETPEELMKQLDFTEQDLQNFMHRLEERLADEGTDQTAEAEAARRQFDTLLRGTDYQSEGGRKDGGNGPRKASQSFGSTSRPSPPEYKKDGEAYKKRLSKQVGP